MVFPPKTKCNFQLSNNSSDNMKLNENKKDLLDLSESIVVWNCQFGIVCLSFCQKKKRGFEWDGKISAQKIIINSSEKKGSDDFLVPWQLPKKSIHQKKSRDLPILCIAVSKTKKSGK